jgi:hypothetical protein
MEPRRRRFARFEGVRSDYRRTYQNAAGAEAGHIRLGPAQSARVSLSKILLQHLGAAGARIQTKAAGDTRDLSFRDLDNYALINETKIQAETSPVLSGQYVLKPAETAVFKYILTGVDDSALDMAKPETSQPMRQAAQLELLDRQIRDLDQEIAAADHDQDELEKLDSSLEEQLAESFQVQEEAESDYRELTGRRRRLRLEHEDAQDRIAEIDTLLARFTLLEQHYGSDQDRLAAIIEAELSSRLGMGKFARFAEPIPRTTDRHLPVMVTSTRSSRRPGPRPPICSAAPPNSS